MPEEDLQHHRKVVSRGKHGEKFNGTGPGLSLCKEIVRMHGGGMERQNKEGEGTGIIPDFPYREAA
jgi:signal transduction histidine kinase